MPIRGRTSQECFETFHAHVSQLAADVLPAPSCYVSMVRGPDANRRDMQLGPDGADYVDLHTRTGKPVKFYLAQDLRVFERPKADVANASERFQLKTNQYWYKVFDVQPGLADEPVLRWEYTAQVPTGKRWCRHHFQIGRVARTEGGERKAIEIEVPFSTGSLDLNRVHIPTGFTLMEFVFRFLFTELDVVPATEDWEAKLRASEDSFFRDFSAKTSTP
jgi:hypothetical protein